MAKEQDQTQQTEEENAEVVETTEEDTSIDKAVKTSEAFDDLIDKNPEDVEDAPPEDKDDEKKDSKESGDKDASKADDKDTGKDEDEDPDKDDDKDADKTGDDETKVSDELAKRAIDLGLTEEEIGQFSSDEELEKTVSIIESVVKEEDAVETVDSTQAADTKKTEDEDTGIKFENEGDIDPEILKAFRSVEQQNKELREKVGKLEGNVQQEQQNRQAEQNRLYMKRFDGYVDGLGLDFADVFGKGSTNDLSKRSKAFKNREAVSKRMFAFGQGFQAAKETIPDEKHLFDMAINSLHGEKVKIVQGLRSGKKNRAYKKGAQVGRSATRKTGKLTGDQKALATNKAFDELIDTSED